MGFDVIASSKVITSKYHRYLQTMFDIKDEDYKNILNERIKKDETFEKGPFLEVTNSFKKGRGIKELINDGILSKEFENIKSLYNIPNLYKHQENALLKSLRGENLVVSTGTGSGKTESFLIPIINELMREKENGTLTDGVRALIIYPMNALANDQIDRLRKTFIDYPDITFGCYTGQTRECEETTKNGEGAKELYEKLNGKREDVIRLRTPLPNERISREKMKENPPHILITNYAMLEYLMLRPEDNVFFDGDYAKNWKYIVLDEAHTYTGSTGIEVSMLLRRVLAKISPSKVQFILTSATLGDESSNDEVIKFAYNLCGVPFSKEGIVRADRVVISKGELTHKLDNEFYLFVGDLIEKGNDDIHIINEIENKYHFGIDEKELSSYLYDLLITDDVFWKIKDYVSSSPRKVSDLMKHMTMNEKDIVSFVNVASLASRNGSKLFDSRYHMFIKAPEGVFITLAPYKDLFLTRKNIVYKDNVQYKVFEALTCSQCHVLYLLGEIQDNYLVQHANMDLDGVKKAFYLGNKVNDDDSDNSLKDSSLAVEAYELCPHCGYIRKKNMVHKTTCGHDENDFIDVIEVETTKKKNGRVTKCIACENSNNTGILRGFFTGQEASTSVIATSLFEELPDKENKIIYHNESEDEFGFEEENTTISINKAKQFISFSDNRQAAAYFASYLSKTYEDILHGKMIVDMVGNIKNNSEPLDIFVGHLEGDFVKKNIPFFDEYLEKKLTGSVASYDYENNAWKSLLKELSDCNSRNSLIGLGLLSIDISDKIPFFPLKYNNFTEKEIKDICMVFIKWMLADSAMICPVNMTENDMKYYLHNNAQYSYLKDTNGYLIKSFLPQENKTNKRMNYLTRIIKKDIPNEDDAKIKRFLASLWDKYFASEKQDAILSKNKQNHYQVNLNNLIVNKNPKWFRCSKCNKLTTLNVRGVCPTFKCNGKLEEVDIDAMEKGNHYYRMYNDMKIQPLRVVEHTAQIERETAYKYQNLFKDMELDVLSCSTTFEMGVDVGSLETVFMRNMPPSPSNYAQRAGRAGRSASSAAFALTFCNRSNHDFNFFNKPLDMINGKIMPPQFRIENEKICIRHIYSAALSFFLKKYPQYFGKIINFMDDNNEKGVLSGYSMFEKFLKDDSPERNDLRTYLLEFVPIDLHEKFMIDSFGWVNWLFANKNLENDCPSLCLVRKRYMDELNQLNKMCNDAYDERGNTYVIEEYKKRIKTYENERIISFLSKNNILPKYGFPVDTIQLETPVDSKLGIELTRDLSIAISEYAPGGEVVANNKLLTSQYVKKYQGFEWKKYDYYHCNCDSLNVIPYSSDKKSDSYPLKTCKYCGCDINIAHIKTFIIPEFGFISSKKIEKPTLIKPERTYSTEASFYSYNNDVNSTSYKIGNAEVKTSYVGNNGEIVILNISDFYVCPLCGFSMEKQDEEDFMLRKKKNIHNDPKGYKCSNEELIMYSLGYKFKSDIIKISIDTPLQTGESEKAKEAYSILQALVLAACRMLNIENTELAGCLEYSSRFNYNYILYDTTPGGAGHVKRLNTKQKMVQLLINARNIAMSCESCDSDSSCYNCLRTYQNQRHHDDIKRNYVYNYLSLVLEGYKDDGSDSKLEDEFLFKLLSKAASWELKGNDKNIYSAVFNGYKWDIVPQVKLGKNDGINVNSQPDFVLYPENKKQKKIAVFTDGYAFHKNILDKDTLKRSAILKNSDYRVWSLSWHGVEENYNIDFTKPIFDKDIDRYMKFNNLKINEMNTFSLLLDYLNNVDAEKDFKEASLEYLDSVEKTLFNDSDILSVLPSDIVAKDEITNGILTYDLNLDDVKTFVSKEKIIIYINDDSGEQKSTFIKEWNTYLQMCNLFQFGNKLVLVSKNGLINKIY